MKVESGKKMLPSMPIIGAVPSLADAHCTGQPYMGASREGSVFKKSIFRQAPSSGEQKLQPGKEDRKECFHDKQQLY
jgi:hypothetical protein